VVPAMRQAGGGSIINLASLAATYGMPFALHYTTSKAAVIGLTRGLARELGRDRIRVNALAPSAVLTDGTREFFGDKVDRALEVIKTGQSMALVAFSLMLVVAAFEARSETGTAFDTDIFNSSRMNVIAVAEVAAAFLITQADFMNRLLGTTQLTAAQWGFAFLAAVVLLLGWEAGKWIARRRAQAKHAITPAR